MYVGIKLRYSELAMQLAKSDKFKLLSQLIFKSCINVLKPIQNIYNDRIMSLLLHSFNHPIVKNKIICEPIADQRKVTHNLRYLNVFFLFFLITEFS